MHAGTAGTCERACLVRVAKARAEAPDLLASPIPEGDALLHRGRYGLCTKTLSFPQSFVQEGSLHKKSTSDFYFVLGYR